MPAKFAVDSLSPAKGIGAMPIGSFYAACLFSLGYGTVVESTEYGTLITLPAPTREGYKFLYWKGSQYNAGDEYAVKGAHTFTAVWEKAGEAAQGGAPATRASAPVPTAGSSNALPATGDNSFMAITLLLAAAIAAAVALFVARKRMQA